VWHSEDVVVAVAVAQWMQQATGQTELCSGNEFTLNFQNASLATLQLCLVLLVFS